MKKCAAILLALVVAAALAVSAFAEAGDIEEKVENMVLYYGLYGSQAAEQIDRLLGEIREIDPEAAEKYKKIFDYWRFSNEKMPVYSDVLPDGLNDTDKLCIVVLGYQLNADGSMKNELIGRLKVALACAEKYPNACILCTGGATASKNAKATEAGEMAKWLKRQGVPAERILIEKKAKTTVGNALYSIELIRKNRPDIRSVAVVSSDYHVPRSCLLFQISCELSNDVPGNEKLQVVSNAAYRTDKKGISLEEQMKEVAQILELDELEKELKSGKIRELPDEDELIAAMI